MIHILHLSDDILVNIIELYSKTYIKCKIDINEKNNIIFCKKIHLLYNTLNHNCKCNILYIKDINSKICSHHNNVSLDLVKSVINQINYIDNNNTNNDIIDSNMILIDIDNHGHYIHYEDLKKNEFILRFILNKYNYKLLNYCCGGNGCQIVKHLNI